MKDLRYLVIAGGMLLGASNIAAQDKDFPEFHRMFVADTKVPLVTAKGPILFEGKSYEVHNSPVRTIHELRGYMDVPIKIIGIKGIDFRLGAITRIDGTTIESIIYTNTRDETMSEYDKRIAKREGIDIEGLTSLWHEKYDLADSTITNMETGEIRPMNNARDFQELYFDITTGKDRDIPAIVHFCGEDYKINIKVRGRVIEADLTYPDPDNPEKRKELIPGILSMSAHTDEYGLPEKMVAGARIVVDFYPEATYDPKRKWVEER